jgi:eukaryotic-like serine/threonine-protein kinase
MLLTSGTKLGPYEIQSPLGAGGMGEVYLARDTRLERTVAVKILPAHFSSDPQARQRFEREAKTISKLNHPHICILYDIGSDSGVTYLVMERVEGETLASRLQRGPLQLQQALKYGSEIADALDKAHRCGVVHRDLKPENIMLTPTGSKLLDFGLAKPTAAIVTAATITAAAANPRVTEQGTIIGTFQYMSPEQIEGKELDGRSDIFSLGAVIYEMITGKRAFEGKSQLSVVSAILEKEPVPISDIKPLSPPGLDHAIRRSLAKDPNERWQGARDFGLELKWIADVSSQTGASIRPTAPHRKHERLIWALALILGAVVLAGFVAYRYLATSTPTAIVSDIAPPKGTVFNFFANGAPAISPNGRAVAFATRDKGGKSALWIRNLDGSPAQLIPGSEEAGGPFWSPDSQKVGFFSGRRLMTFEIMGGSVTSLSEGALPNLGGAGSWGRTGTILFVGVQGIYQVAASGGSTALVVSRETSKYAFLFSPAFLPDGKHFLYEAANPGLPGDIYFASLDGKENRLLLRGGGRTIYASGYLLYIRGPELFAQPFDPAAGLVTGTARRIVDHVQQAGFNAFFDASQNGVLVFEPGNQATNVTQLAWFDRTGKKLALIGTPAVHYDLRLSPDAHRLASSAGVPKSEIWVDDLLRGVRMRLTFDPETDNGDPVWSPDGNTLLFSTLRGSKAGVGIFRKASNGSGEQELFLSSDKPDREAWATDWSRDGRFLLFSRGDMANYSEGDIWVLPLIGEKKAIQFLHPAGGSFDAQFSPDGRWVAYVSRESGSFEVYVTSFDPAKVLNRDAAVRAGKWQISNDRGTTPRWRRDGKELFYMDPGNTIISVEVKGQGQSFEVGRSQRLFVAPANPFASTYDVTPDGQRFVMSTSPEEEEVSLSFVLNWTARLRTTSQ